jgi:phosphomannomutase
VTPDGPPADLVGRARAWIAADPDPVTRAELAALVDSLALHTDTHAAAALADRMAPLRFGTAGLRGPVRGGPNGMNVAVVRRTTAGLAAWLAGRGLAGGTVVVGRDARHGSAAFAEACAGVLAAAGFDVRTLPGPLPTPLLAYAVRALPAVAGVQITASHNPAADNGYKVYLGFGDHAGAQLVAPHDAEIEAAIAAAPPAAAVPVLDGAGTPCDPLPGYLDRVARLPRCVYVCRAKPPRIALTALHGVGAAVAVRALRAAGFPDVHLVAGQAEPDPDFPTVASPNPEDPAATAALLALAAEVDADLAVALDPDADRCAIGVRDPAAPGGRRMLTGDEVGALLGDHILATTGSADPLVATTLVSSGLLARIAAARGARHAETPTGFKWIVRAGPGLVYGYEEAIGYCVDPDGVRDKDGIAAAVLVADLATRGPLTAALDALAVRHGVHRTASRRWSMTPERIAAALDRFGRAAGVRRPAPDLLVRRTPGQRVAVRPSGTEPVLKAYLEVVEPVAGAADLPAATERARHRLAMLDAELATSIGEGDPPSPPC